MKETLEWVCLKLEMKKEKERHEMREEASWEAEAKYLALDAFSLVRANYFWEGWEEFKDVASERFLDIDFSSLKPEELKPRMRRKRMTMITLWL